MNTHYRVERKWPETSYNQMLLTTSLGIITDEYTIVIRYGVLV